MQVETGTARGWMHGAYVMGLAAVALVLAVVAASAGIVVSIDKVAQSMTVAIDGRQTYVWPVSTGGPGYTTPTGAYTPFRMEPDHFSEEWDDAPMPHSIFFTYQGHAIHGSLSTRSLGQPVSHGCVRLAPANAAILYDLVERRGLNSTKIVVHDGDPRKATAVATRQAPPKKKKKLSPLWRLYQ